MHQCGSAAQAQQHLLAEGFDQQQAAEVLPRALELVIVESAARLQSQGTPEADAAGQLAGTGLLPEKHVAELVGRVFHPTWFRRHPIASLSLGTVLMVLGLPVMFAGLVLRDGNLSGKFVTFPFAGGLTIFLGVVVFVVGLTLAAMPFMRIRVEDDAVTGTD